jgi:phosphonate transport system ATP-binding protein
MNLHSVDLALAYFPRVVGVRQGRVAFDLPAAGVTAEVLEALYAGALRDDAPLPGYEHASAISRVCRPAPGLR